MGYGSHMPNVGNMKGEEPFYIRVEVSFNELKSSFFRNSFSGLAHLGVVNEFIC